MKYTYDEFTMLEISQQKRIIKDYNDMQSFERFVKIGVSVVLFVIIAGMVGCPQYKVWSQGQEGMAELARAEQNRQIAVNEAKARNESAEFLASAEVTRAQGVAKANQIIADGLGGPEGYLRYIYIDALKETHCQTVYIPTEAGLPILEAGRTLNKHE